MSGSAGASPFPVRGAMEAFYGAFYTFPERKDLIRFLGRCGFNFFMYGPKNDRQHRSRWWEEYPARVLDDFEETIHVARGAGVQFCYAISFGSPVESIERDIVGPVTDKLCRFYERGCRSFALLLDDITIGFNEATARDEFREAALAHVDIANRIWQWVQTLPDASSLYVCPSEYFGVAPFSEYLHTFGSGLLPGMEVFYCGPAVCSPSIDVDDVRGFAEAVGRAPVIWDNYPVNDLRMRPYMHIGPLRHRSAALPEVCRGFVSNLMPQVEASKIPLLTIADYVAAPSYYDPDASWQHALRVVGRSDSVDALTRIAENSLHSCLHKEEAPLMDRLARAAIAALRAGEPVLQSEAVRALAGYFTEIDESGYHMKNRMQNLQLRDDLLPWIEALEDRVWMARRALSTLQAIEGGEDFRPPLRSMKELRRESDRNPKHIGGRTLNRLVDYVQTRATEAGATLSSGVNECPTSGNPLGDPAAFGRGEMESGYIPQSHPA